MLTAMRHTAVLVLVFVLLALVMVCGDPATTSTGVSIPEPTPDIEATVEAKVQERLRIDATVEATGASTQSKRGRFPTCAAPLHMLYVSVRSSACNVTPFSTA